ncbi:glycosyltransferase family 4 protein [Psychroserpens sp. Hel_I_66]|uniref:glycosyltransferase family 4 protein n=1 Tax=Psychroserpens sp. Hel_I_66 TaxID=1250004 RepID=UPI000646A5F8|nr:glycosyltransferase family 4 protein [Psychroserpens sp. Hel_I_66]
MKKSIQIAIYSGEIPSTTFIERLILGVSKSNEEVLLFGVLRQKLPYHNSITIHGCYNHKLSKFWFLLKYSSLLLLIKPKEKKRLDTYLKQQNNLNLGSKVKFYPVLWHKPDIFHIQWAKGLKDWIWVQEFGMKLVLSLRGAHINYSPITDLDLAQLYKKHFPNVDGFHAVSDAIAKEATKYGASIDRVKVIYSGLPNFEINPEILLKNKDFNSELNSNEPLHLLSVGRPHWKKGYTYALDACKILKTSGLNFKYTIIGGADDVELLYQVHDLHLQDDVFLIEKQTFESVKDYMLKATILLLPSVEEGIANVVLESMALGTLVLSTACGGMNEVITDTENGFLVPIRDSEAIANAIVNIAALPENRKNEIRERAKNTISKQHNEDLMTSGMLQLYKSVIE